MEVVREQRVQNAALPDFHLKLVEGGHPWTVFGEEPPAAVVVEQNIPIVHDGMRKSGRAARGSVPHHDITQNMHLPNIACASDRPPDTP